MGCTTQEQYITSHTSISHSIVTPDSNNAMSVPIIADDGVLFKKSSIAGYQLTDADLAFISAPNKPISFKTYQGDNGEIITVPSFKLRNILKSGTTDDGFSWKVTIKEISVDVFQISGSNSKGIFLNAMCYDLAECFHKI